MPSQEARCSEPAGRGREGASHGLEAHGHPQPSPPHAGRRKAGREAGAEARRGSPKNGKDEREEDRRGRKE